MNIMIPYQDLVNTIVSYNERVADKTPDDRKASIFNVPVRLTSSCYRLYASNYESVVLGQLWPITLHLFPIMLLREAVFGDLLYKIKHNTEQRRTQVQRRQEAQLRAQLLEETFKNAVEDYRKALNSEDVVVCGVCSKIILKQYSCQIVDGGYECISCSFTEQMNKIIREQYWN